MLERIKNFVETFDKVKVIYFDELHTYDLLVKPPLVQQDKLIWIIDNEEVFMKLHDSLYNELKSNFLKPDKIKYYILGVKDCDDDYEVKVFDCENLKKKFIELDKTLILVKSLF